MDIVKKQVGSDNEVDVGALLRLLRVNIWVVIILVTISMVGAFIYVHRHVPQFKSDVLLQVDSDQPGGSKGGISAVFASGYAGDSVEMQIALIKSRFILDRVVQKLGLDISTAAPKKSIFSRFFSSRINKHSKVDVRVFEVPHAFINQGFHLKVDSPTTFSLFSPDGKPVVSGRVGELVTNDRKTIRIWVEEIQAPVATDFFLTKSSKVIAVNDLINRLEITEEGAVRGRSGTGILDMSMVGQDPKKIVTILNTIAKIAQEEDAKKKAREASKTLTFLQQQLPITKMELEKAEHALNHYRAKSGKIDVKLQTQFLLNQLLQQDTKLESLRIEKLSLSQYYTPNHPSYIALQTQIRQLQKQRIKQEKVIQTLPLSEQKDVNLLRDVNVKQTLYLVLLNKIQELQVVKAGTISSLRILSKAQLPDFSLPFKRAPIYVGGLLMGVMLSMVFIFGRRIWSSQIDDPQWIERHSGIPTLAIIPYCKEQVGVISHSKELTLLAHSNPKNLTVEALRSLRTSLQVSLAGASNNIISILGAAPGVGKSFVSVNLAYLLAVSGKKVIVIDADLRRGTIHKYLNLRSSPGLTDVLNGSTSLDMAVQTTMQENLYCLPRGVYPNDPSELLMNSTFKSTIETISQQYDVVIIDTSPILLVTDGVIVGGFASINYLVLGAGAHQPADIEMAIKKLSSADVQVNGAIFNFHKERKKFTTDYYGYYYSNYSYYYRDTETS